MTPANASSTTRPAVLVLTPVKDAARFLEDWAAGLERLRYPPERLSVACLESDSADRTWERLEALMPRLRSRFRSARIFKHDFGFRIPDGVPRWDSGVQLRRRAILALSRNQLLFRALGDEDWVLWLDVDVLDYPPDVLDRLLATGKDIVQPHCLHRSGGATFDRNAWRDRGRFHLDDLRDEGDLVPLDTVGGTMLLVRADAHRNGLIFPPFLYGKRSRRIRPRNGFVRRWQIGRLLAGEAVGEIETEGFGILAHDMGYECWGMPGLEIRHRDE